MWYPANADDEVTQSLRRTLGTAPAGLVERLSAIVGRRARGTDPPADRREPAEPVEHDQSSIG